MKEIIFRIINLVVSPHREWQTIVTESQTADSVRQRFLFPFLLLVFFVISFDCLIRFDWYSNYVFSDFLKDYARQSLIIFSSLFAGVYLSSLILTQILPIEWVAGIKKNFDSSFLLIVHSSSIMWVIVLIHRLIPAFFFMPIFHMYVVYVIWCGLPLTYPPLKDDKRGRMAIIVAGLMYLSPIVIGKVMSVLM